MNTCSFYTDRKVNELSMKFFLFEFYLFTKESTLRFRFSMFWAYIHEKGKKNWSMISHRMRSKMWVILCFLLKGELSPLILTTYNQLSCSFREDHSITPSWNSFYKLFSFPLRCWTHFITIRRSMSDGQFIQFGSRLEIDSDRIYRSKLTLLSLNRASSRSNCKSLAIVLFSSKISGYLK